RPYLRGMRVRPAVSRSVTAGGGSVRRKRRVPHFRTRGAGVFPPDRGSIGRGSRARWVRVCGRVARLILQSLGALLFGELLDINRAVLLHDLLRLLLAISGDLVHRNQRAAATHALSVELRF